MNMLWWKKKDPHALVDEHFSAQLSPRHTATLWQHLESCGRCRDRYQAHALLEALEGDAELRARRRLAPAELAPAPISSRWRGAFALTFAVAVSGFLLFILAPGLGTREEFASRGGAADNETPSLAVYRVPSTQDPQDLPKARARATDRLEMGEGLAFSYLLRRENHYSSLMIFAVDAAGRVFWFWPAWQSPAQDPKSIALVARTEPVELPEAVFHDYQPGPLHIYGLFSNEPHSVKEVEATLAAAGVGGLARPGDHLWAQQLEVQP